MIYTKKDSQSYFFYKKTTLFFSFIFADLRGFMS